MPIRNSRILLGLLAGLGAFMVAGCGSEAETGASDAAPPAAAAPTPAPAAASGEMPATPASDPASTSAEATAATATASSQGAGEKLPKNPVVELDTSMGKIRIQLDSEKAPVSTKNFVDYVKSGHYDGTVFHRVIEDFMIQGGGFSADMNEKQTRAPIKNEGGNGLKNVRGTVAMARTNVPDSATAQFFVNVKDNDFLNRESSQDGAGYAVFGKVTSGMDVVDKIRKVKTDVKNTPQGPMENVPVTAVVIKSAKLVK